MATFLSRYGNIAHHAHFSKTMILQLYDTVPDYIQSTFAITCSTGNKNDYGADDYDHGAEDYHHRGISVGEVICSVVLL